MTRTYKKGKRGKGNFVQLHNWILSSEAWRNLKPGPRALYLELKARFNGNNNGLIILSHREAQELLNVGRDTAGKYFTALSETGFIKITKGHCLGPAGIGQSSSYALTEKPLDGAPASKEFMAWKKQKPRRKIQHSLAGKSDTPCRKIQHSPSQMSENPTAFAQNDPTTVLENPAIYTSNHIPTDVLNDEAATSSSVVDLASYCERIG